jgi:uncharacterized metal-binding protein YceD (DUF177 family)
LSKLLKQDRAYIINFGHLKLGKHEYSFEVDHHFFDEYTYSLVKQGRIKVNLELDKEKETLLVLDFKFAGEIEVKCDRCLDKFEYPIENTARILVKLTDKKEDPEADELIYLPMDAWEINLKPLIYEFINLELPLKRLCSLIDKECNPEVITYLKKQEEEENAGEPDPRWKGLEELKEKKNESK